MAVRLVQDHLEEPGGAPVPVALRDVRPRLFPEMPEVQLPSRLHCVPAGQKGHSWQGAKYPPFTNLGTLLTLVRVTLSDEQHVPQNFLAAPLRR